MGHTMAAWKTLEDLLIELKRKNVEIPENIVADLRAARSMIELSCSEGSQGESLQKAEEYTASVEAFLINEAQQTFGPEAVDEWLRRLEEANAQDSCGKEAQGKGKFVVGVPRDQKWIRIEPSSSLSEANVLKLAGERNLMVNKQTDGRLVVHGQAVDVKAFVKQVAAETAKKP
jgi:hypothetical protein